MNYDIPLIIFAGGKSSRMGRDKALLPFGDHTSLAQFQQTKFAPYFKTIYLSAKSDKFDFACRVIEDKQTSYSPLIAIISIFEYLDAEEIFILSVDAPFIDIQIIERILKEREEGMDCVVATTPSGLQPLCGVYKKTILPLALTQLEKKNHKLQDLLELAQTKKVCFKKDEAFLNLNHPQEYQTALSLFQN